MTTEDEGKSNIPFATPALAVNVASGDIFFMYFSHLRPFLRSPNGPFFVYDERRRLPGVLSAGVLIILTVDRL
jgi:hypothetical protein